MTISALIATLVVAHILPALVALLTKSAASAWLKQFLGAVLAAVTGLIVTSTQLDGTAVLSKESVFLALATFISTQAIYKGVYAPHAVNDKLAPGVGIG